MDGFPRTAGVTPAWYKVVGAATANALSGARNDTFSGDFTAVL